MTFGIDVFVQLQNSFPGELKTTKPKITHTNVTEDLFVKKNVVKNYTGNLVKNLYNLILK